MKTEKCKIGFWKWIALLPFKLVISVYEAVSSDKNASILLIGLFGVIFSFSTLLTLLLIGIYNKYLHINLAIFIFFVLILLYGTYRCIYCTAEGLNKGEGK